MTHVSLIYTQHKYMYETFKDDVHQELIMTVI